MQWLKLKPSELLELEAGEDIDLIRNGINCAEGFDRFFQAVKHREKKGLTLRSPEALEALAGFHEHRATNPNLRLRFRYVTTSRIAAEKPRLFESDRPGILEWERIRTREASGKAKASLLSAIKRYLKGAIAPKSLSDHTWSSFVNYIGKSSAAELNCFIDAFEWSVDQPGAGDIEGLVKQELIKSRMVGGEEDAEQAFRHLFYFVFNLLSNRTKKVLSCELLSQQLARPHLAESGRSVLSAISALKTGILSRFDRLEEQVAPLQVIAETVSRIDNQLQQVVPHSAVEVRALQVYSEQLAEAVSEGVNQELVAIREKLRIGRRMEALQAVRARKSRAAWLVLESPEKAAFLRLEAGIVLDYLDDKAQARQLLNDARSLAPDEDDSLLRALIALADSDADTALKLLVDKQDYDSKNLTALLSLFQGRVDDCLRLLPPLDSSAARTAETLRIRCLAFIAKRDLVQARLAITEALLRMPEWPTLQLLDASLLYYESLSPAALEYWALTAWPQPDTSNFGMDTPESLEKLRRAENIFARWERWSDTTLEERRLLEAWHLACLSADPTRQTEAAAYAIQSLARDPAQHRLIPWVIDKRYKDLDLREIRQKFGELVDSGRPTVIQVAGLVALQISSREFGDAISTLNSTRSVFLGEKCENVGHHLKAVALLGGGEIEQAKLELGLFDLPERSNPLWLEIQRFESMRSGDWDAYAELLKHNYVSSGSAIALFDLCLFEAHRGNWNAVSEHATELVERVGTVAALALAADSLLNVGLSAECIALIESKRERFRLIGQAHSEHFQELVIAAQQRMGRLLEARQGAQSLCQKWPSTRNFLLLAQLQLETGDGRALAISAHSLEKRPDLSAEEALRIGTLVRREDPKIAKSLWRRAITGNLPDEFVGAATNLGFHLGLDGEMAALMTRLNDLGRQGRAGIVLKNLTDVISDAKRHNESIDRLNSLYRLGQIPIHCIPTSDRLQLVSIYHEALSQNESNTPVASNSLLARHGGRTFHEHLFNPSDSRLNVDITSLLLSEHFGLLDKIEDSFKTVRLPPSIFVALTAMQDALSARQVSQIEAAREVISAVDKGLVQVSTLSTNPVAEGPDLARKTHEWHQLCELARASGGRPVGFVSHPDFASVPAVGVRDYPLSCLALADALYSFGALSSDEYRFSIENLGLEGSEPFGGDIERGSKLFCQAGIATFLAGCNLFKAASTNFELHLLKKEEEHLRALLSDEDEARRSAYWIETLASRIRKGLEIGTYELIAARDSRKADLPDEACLFELLAFRPDASDVICADDRYFNAYRTRDTAPIVSLVEILKSLVSFGHLTIHEYYGVLNRFRGSNIFFIPLEKDEILHHLLRARLDSKGRVFETPELAVLRRYWARGLLRSTFLQRPGGPVVASPEGEISFLQASSGAIRDALAGLWADAPLQAEGERLARAEWLLGALYVDYLGSHALGGFVAGGLKDSDLVGISYGSLILGGFSLRLVRVLSPKALVDYQQWLYRRLLQDSIEREGALSESIGKHVRIFLRMLWQDVETEQRKPMAAGLLELLESLPKPVKDIVEDDDAFKRGFGVLSAMVVQVGDLTFPKSEYFEATRAAVNGRTGNAKLWRSEEEASFTRVGIEDTLIIEIKTQGSTQPRTIADPVLGLLADAPEDRKRFSSQYFDWLDGNVSERSRIINKIVEEDDPVARIDGAHKLQAASATAFYSSLLAKLQGLQMVSARDFRPPDADALFKAYRLTKGLSSSSFTRQLAAGAKEVMDEEGLLAAFQLYSAFPVPIPSGVVDQIRSLEDPEKRLAIKNLLKIKGSPLLQIHLLSLLSRVSDTPKSVYWRLATRMLGSLISKEGAEIAHLFWTILRWVNDQFAVWPDTKSWTTVDRLAMVWAHAHRLFSIFRSVGLSEDWLSARFVGGEFGIAHKVLEHSAEYSNDVACPNRAIDDSVLSSLVYALADKPEHWWKSKVLRSRFQSLLSDDDLREIGLEFTFLRDSSLATNVLGSFLRQDHEAFLISMVQDETHDPPSAPNRNEILIQSLKKISEDRGNLEGWVALHLVLGGLPPPPEHRQSVVSAILQVDLTPLAADMDACEAILAAASSQAAALRDAAAAVHLSLQLLAPIKNLCRRLSGGSTMGESDRRFLSSVFTAAANLSLATADCAGPAEGLSTILAQIMETCPEAAAVYFLHLRRMWPCKSSQARLLWPLLVRSRSVDAK
jgi:hypothetical protein